VHRRKEGNKEVREGGKKKRRERRNEGRVEERKEVKKEGRRKELNSRISPASSHTICFNHRLAQAKV